MASRNNFQIDCRSVEDGCLYVDLPNIATVQIRDDEEGIKVDIYRADDESEPVASLLLREKDLLDDN